MSLLDKIENVFNTKTFQEIKEEKVKQILEGDEPLSDESCGNFIFGKDLFNLARSSRQGVSIFDQTGSAVRSSLVPCPREDRAFFFERRRAAVWH